MARKAGRPPADPKLVALRGDTRTERQVVQLYPDIASRPDPEHMPAPADMTLQGQLIWDEKVALYKQRGQKVQGFEHALRNYCELEAIVRDAVHTGSASAAFINALRGFAVEFYDTPASQRIGLRSAKPIENKFTTNGRRTGS